MEVKIKVEGLSLENMPFRKGAKCLIRRKNVLSYLDNRTFISFTCNFLWNNQVGYLVKSYQVCDSQDFLSVKYEPYNVPTSKDIKIGAGVELVLTGMLPPCSKTYAQCFISFHFIIAIFGTKGQKDKLSSIYLIWRTMHCFECKGPWFWRLWKL